MNRNGNDFLTKTGEKENRHESMEDLDNAAPIEEEEREASDNDNKTTEEIKNTSSEKTDSVEVDAVEKRKTPKTGVIYLSRIPPGMERNKLRALLRPVCRTGRIWLRPEGGSGGAYGNSSHDRTGNARRSGEDGMDGETRQRRRQVAYRDGWVEFPSRRDAKRAVELLNGQPMAGAKRRGAFANDLWVMRLLRGFTWDDLRQEMLGSERERVLKVREEVASARRERTWVESRVALRKRIDKYRKNTTPQPVRHFRQKSVLQDDDERRAVQAAQRVDQELESGIAKKLDDVLVGKLFKKRKP